jgi:hypothetical protein
MSVARDSDYIFVIRFFCGAHKIKDGTRARPVCREFDCMRRWRQRRICVCLCAGGAFSRSKEGGWMRQIGAKGLSLVSEMPIFVLRLKRPRGKERDHTPHAALTLFWHRADARAEHFLYEVALALILSAFVGAD